MEPVYALMMYGVAAVMIFFIATITAGIVLGTFLMLMNLGQTVRGARRTHPVMAIRQPKQGSTGAPG